MANERRYGLYLSELEALQIILKAITYCFVTVEHGLTTDRTKWNLTYKIDVQQDLWAILDAYGVKVLTFNKAENELISLIVFDVLHSERFDPQTGTCNVPSTVLMQRLHEKAETLKTLQEKIKTAIDELKEQESEVTHG